MTSSARTQLRFVTFNGGRGARSLIRQLLDSGHAVTSIVNAYDDGRSTGELRKAFDMLGPSDIAKTAISMADPRVGRTSDLIRVLEYRFPSDLDEETLHDDLVGLARNASNPTWFHDLKIFAAKHGIPAQLRESIASFLDAEMREACHRVPLRDMAFRNLVLAGAFLSCDRSWERAISIFGGLLGSRGEILLNSEENRWLIGIRADSSVERTEYGISETTGASFKRLFLLRASHPKLSGLWSHLRVPSPSIADRVAQGESLRRMVYRIISDDPPVSPAVVQALKRANFIIYCPGTLHSSLLPTFMCKDMPAAIAASGAKKICVVPITRTPDTHGMEDIDFVRTILDYLGAKRSRDFPLYVDEVIVPRSQSSGAINRVKLRELESAGIRVAFRNVQDQSRPGFHDPVKVQRHILQARRASKRSLVYHMEANTGWRRFPWRIPLVRKFRPT